MTKQELTIEHMVIYRNGNSLNLDLMDGVLDSVKDHYSDNLTDVSGNRDYDIMEVIRDGVSIWKRVEQENPIQAKMQADHEAQTDKYKAKKEAGRYAFESDEATKKYYQNVRQNILMFPESVQNQIFNAMSEEMRLKLVGL